MKVVLIGTGCGTGKGMLTGEAAEALSRAELLLGPARLLDALPEGLLPGGCQTREAAYPEAIFQHLEASACENAAVLFSGDSGFFSGCRKLLPLLEAAGSPSAPSKRYEVSVLPGISSMQLFAARLGRPWQDWGLYSAHGVDCDILQAVCRGKPAFFLTGGKLDPSEICLRLSEAGLGDLEVSIGENLGYAEEKIHHGKAWDFAAHGFPPLSVLLAEAAPRYALRVPGVPDADFIRKDGIPMTKQEVRAVLAAKLALSPEDVCWDIGTGTGSVSIELALQARAVYGIEYRQDSLALAQENRKLFGAWNLRLIEGRAPEALDGLPVPDAVFIGGSEGRIRDILHRVYSVNPGARICISAITLEGLYGACSGLEELGYETELAQVSVNRGKSLGGYHLMLAQNSVYLVSGKRQGQGV